MCGIAGIWNHDGRPVSDPELVAFRDTMAHRGPDGAATWHDADAGLALAHRRLAILDVSDDGRQPMVDPDGRFVITFNGEIYNFLELREELRARGHRFRSETDTEVLLAAFAEWGEAMLPRLNGMWAFAIWDRRARRLFLARDRFGIKPLLYRATDDQFAFASELKAFRGLRGYAPALDAEAAQRFLETGFGVESTGRTMFAGVQGLPPGCSAVVAGGRVSVRRWWVTVDHLVTPPASFAAQAERFAELFEDAVRLRMRSDVPIGSCLSGGFDSTAVVCALAAIGRGPHAGREAAEWQRTFVATFPGADNDERPAAEEAARYAGVRAHFFPVDESQALLHMDEVLTALDDVYIVVPTAIWLIYRELRRERVVVSLDGHGADELMGGYRGGDALRFADAPSWLAHPGDNLRRAMDYLRAGGSLGGLLRLQLRYHPGLAGLQPLARWARSALRLRQLGGAGQFVRRGLPRLDAAFKPAGSADPLPAAWGPLNRELYHMFHGTVLPTILRNFDRLSMAHGIEVRMPFMDWRLVTFVMSLPDSSRIGDGQTKRVAREALRGRMPESIRSSPVKIGFNSPLPGWMDGPLVGWTDELLTAPEHPLIDLPALRRFVGDLRSGRRWSWLDAAMVWPCLHLLWFERRFIGGAR